MTYDNPDVFSSDSQFLSAAGSAPRRSPSRQSINTRRSTASLRGSSSLAHTMDQDAGNARFSLAHELAAALMPEPSAGSRLLAEEFGIEYDEGAEGIDAEFPSDGGPQVVVGHEAPSSFAAELETNAHALDDSFQDTPTRHSVQQDQTEYDPVFGSPSARQKKPKRQEQDAMEALSQDLEFTEQFLSHLRHIDSESGSQAAQQPALEKIASDVIRRIDDTIRDREGQVRELLEYEREFRKIAGEVGGNDVLGQLEGLTSMSDLLEDGKQSASTQSAPVHHRLPSTEEELSLSAQSQEWEVDPHRLHLGDEEEEEDNFSAEPSPIKDTFPPPPPLLGPPTPATTIPQLAHFRSFTTSLVASLTTISEHAQVNGAATTEAGRKIRALKNRLGTWRTDWDSAERSRIKIERWEAGLLDGTDTPEGDAPSSGSKRVDGRQFVQEHLQAFERALADAGTKTKAIMASG